jgi:hypothetical protein
MAVGAGGQCQEPRSKHVSAYLIRSGVNNNIGHVVVFGRTHNDAAHQFPIYSELLTPGARPFQKGEKVPKGGSILAIRRKRGGEDVRCRDRSYAFESLGA